MIMEEDGTIGIRLIGAILTWDGVGTHGMDPIGVGGGILGTDPIGAGDGIIGMDMGIMVKAGVVIITIT
jgi:hypothetical protein